MQTLIFNGSPKKNGDTEALINALASHLNGEVKIISSRSNISPCIDCRHCWQNTGCILNDDMQEIYTYLKTCDNIVMASPIWFSSLSGILLNMASRIQMLYTAQYFQKRALPMKEKKGVLILAGGEAGTEIVPTQTALIIMKFMNVHRPSVAKIYSLDTNNVPASKDQAALAQCRKAADILNRSYNDGNTEMKGQQT
ncbi:MAG: flavodoxin family protein [Defluviitaleaceae bacterium]|nr:flavodoxin family protein [Defluviitaleaceae bacterium]